jgi:hypothetical protein
LARGVLARGVLALAVFVSLFCASGAFCTSGGGALRFRAGSCRADGAWRSLDGSAALSNSCPVEASSATNFTKAAVGDGEIVWRDGQASPLDFGSGATNRFVRHMAAVVFRDAAAPRSAFVSAPCFFRLVGLSA